MNTKDSVSVQEKSSAFLQGILDPVKFQNLKFILEEKKSHRQAKRLVKKHLRRDLSRLRKRRNEDRKLFDRYAVFRRSEVFRELEYFFVRMRNVDEWNLPRDYQKRLEQLDQAFEAKLRVYQTACRWKKLEKGKFVYYRAVLTPAGASAPYPQGKTYQLDGKTTLHLYEFRYFFMDEHGELLDDEERFLEVLKRENPIVSGIWNAENPGSQLLPYLAGVFLKRENRL